MKSRLWVSRYNTDISRLRRKWLLGTTRSLSPSKSALLPASCCGLPANIMTWYRNHCRVFGTCLGSCSFCLCCSSGCWESVSEGFWRLGASCHHLSFLSPPLRLEVSAPSLERSGRSRGHLAAPCPAGSSSLGDERRDSTQYVISGGGPRFFLALLLEADWGGGDGEVCVWRGGAAKAGTTVFTASVGTHWRGKSTAQVPQRGRVKSAGGPHTQRGSPCSAWTQGHSQKISIEKLNYHLKMFWRELCLWLSSVSEPYMWVLTGCLSSSQT